MKMKQIFIFVSLVLSPLWFTPVPKYEVYQCVVAPCISPSTTLIEKFISLLFGGI